MDKVCQKYSIDGLNTCGIYFDLKKGTKVYERYHFSQTPMIKKRSLEPFLRKNDSLIIINYGNDLIGPLPYGGPITQIQG